MEVFKCGTNVTPKLNPVPGIITALCIRFNQANYEVSYFCNGEYRIIWLNEDEFEVNDQNPTKIKMGFLKSGTSQ